MVRSTFAVNPPVQKIFKEKNRLVLIKINSKLKIDEEIANFKKNHLIFNQMFNQIIHFFTEQIDLNLFKKKKKV